jgi:hypothetical protein
MKTALTFFGVQFLFYLLIVVNMRFIAGGSYIGTATSDFAIVWVNYLLIQKVASSKTWKDQFWLALGGSAGAMLGLYVTGA